MFPQMNLKIPTKIILLSGTWQANPKIYMKEQRVKYIYDETTLEQQGEFPHQVVKTYLKP